VPHSVVGSVGHLLPQVGTLTWQENLKELVVVQTALLVIVEKSNELCAVPNTNSKGSIVLEKGKQILWANLLQGSSIDSAESRVGTKLGVSADALAVRLNHDFCFANDVKYLFQVEFWLLAQHANGYFIK